MANPRWPQLGFRLFRSGAPGLDDFHPGANPEVPTAVRRWAAGEGPWCVLAWGAAETGKTHLLQAACNTASERGAAAMYVPLREVASLGPAVLEDLADFDALCLDDLEAVTADRAWNEALFGLYNRFHGEGRRLLLAADAAPRELKACLPDLASRLASALVYHLLPLPDEAKREVLAAAAARRGLQMPEAVSSYLLRRLPRGWQALNDALASLDQASLSAGRPLTVPFVREVLGFED